MNAVELLKRFEGFRAKAARLPDGGWTIGYGHTQTAREGAEISERDAEALLLYDLIGVSHAVNALTYAPLTQNQFDALCAFAFNIGVENFRASSVLRRLNEGAHLQAAAAMELWRKADFSDEIIVVDAMVRRRAAEKLLFLTPPDGWVPAPGAVLPPRLDRDLGGAIPVQAPTALTLSLDGDRIVVSREPAPARPSPPDDVDAQSPVLAAAAAVKARLQALLPDEEAEAPAPAASPPNPETSVTPPSVSSIQNAAALDAPRDRPPLKTAHVLLAAFGLSAFAWALYWAFSVETTKADGLFGPLAISWVVGLIGIACFGAAAYFILERLGGEDDARP